MNFISQDTFFYFFLDSQLTFTKYQLQSQLEILLTFVSHTATSYCNTNFLSKSRIEAQNLTDARDEDSTTAVIEGSKTIDLIRKVHKLTKRVPRMQRENDEAA